jgi:hypothetical protein
VERSLCSAGALWGLVCHPDRSEVTAPSKRSQPGITVHRSNFSDADVTVHYGIPVTSPARTLLDLADSLDRASLTRAVHDARLRHLLRLDTLAAQLTPGRKTGVLRELVTRRTAPTRSAFEDAFLAFCDRYRLPRPQINTVVAGGRRLLVGSRDVGAGGIDDGGLPRIVRGRDLCPGQVDRIDRAGVRRCPGEGEREDQQRAGDGH